MIEVRVTGATHDEIVKRAMARARQFYSGARDRDLIVEPFTARPSLETDDGQVLQWEAEVEVWHNR